MQPEEPTVEISTEKREHFYEKDKWISVSEFFSGYLRHTPFFCFAHLITFAQHLNNLNRVMIGSERDRYMTKQEPNRGKPARAKALTNELIAKLESYITACMAELDVPGVSVAIVQDGQVIYSKGFGVRERGRKEPITPETLMMIGSITKSMTTMMMAALVDDGVFKWETPAVEILSSFALCNSEITRKVTMRHMICNCTGVPQRNEELTFTVSRLTAEEIIRWLATAPLAGRFGETFGYNSQMVAAGGYLAALAAGGKYGNLYNDYTALMKERVFNLIGMTESTFSFEVVQASSNYATPHTPSVRYGFRHVPLDVERWITPVAPAGGAWSNAQDMGRYLATQLNHGVAPNGSRVVSAENLCYTWEPQVKIGDGNSYGLGWVIENYRGVRLIHHSGGTYGFMSELAFIPEAGIGIVLLANQLDIISPLVIAVRARFFDLLFAIESSFDTATLPVNKMKQSMTQIAGQIKEQVDPVAVAPYLGTYTNEKLGKLVLRLDNQGRLLFDIGGYWFEMGQLANVPVGLIFLEGIFLGKVLVFSTSTDEKVNMVVEGREDHYVFTKQGN